jgi:hypothetical protein
MGRQPINYEHKKIKRGIEKHWGFEQPQLSELMLSDSIIGKLDLLGKFYTIFDKNYGDNNLYIYIGRVNSCRAGGCSISMDPAEDFNTEYFDYFILFDSAGSVEQVTVFNYAATHGHEVSAKGWLRQFNGYDGSDTLKVGKNVDAISGATISVYGITEDIQLKTKLLKSCL